VSIVVDFVELQAKGVVDLMDQIDAVEKSTQGATDAAVVLYKVMTDPKNRQAVVMLEAVRKETGELLKLDRERYRLTSLRETASGAKAFTTAQAQLKLTRETAAAERDLGRVRTLAGLSQTGTPAARRDAADRLSFARLQAEAARRAGLDDLGARKAFAGTDGAVRDARAKLSYAREEAGVRKAEHRDDLAARYGRAGGGLAALGESKGFGLAAGAAGAASASLLGAATAGFSGTVEAHQFQQSLMFMNREIAGAFVPAMRNATAAANIVRFGFDSMSGSQQRVVSTVALTIAALGALNIALYRTTGFTLMGAAAGALGGLGGGVAAGTGEKIATNAAGGLAAGAGWKEGAKGLANKGMKLLNSTPLKALAVPIAGAMHDYNSNESLYDLSRQAGYSQFGAGVKSALGGAGEVLGFDNLTGTDSRRDLKRERAANDPNKYTFDAARDATDRERIYTLSRNAGRNKFESALNMGFGSLAELTGGNLFGGTDEVRANLRKEAAARGHSPSKEFAPTPPGADGKKDDKTAVTPMLPTLFSEAGATYEEFALAAANSKAAAAGGVESTLGEILAWLKDNVKKDAKNPD
jgi:hypothetical protein